MVAGGCARHQRAGPLPGGWSGALTSTQTAAVLSNHSITIRPVTYLIFEPENARGATVTAHTSHRGGLACSVAVGSFRQGNTR